MSVAEWDLRTALIDKLNSSKDALRQTGKLWRPSGQLTKPFKDADTALTEIENILGSWPAVANLLVRLDGLIPKLGALTALKKLVREGTFARPRLIGLADVESIRSCAQLGIDVAEKWPAERAATAALRFAQLDRTDDDNNAFVDAKAAAVSSWTTYLASAAAATTVDEVNVAAAHLYAAEGDIEAALGIVRTTDTYGAITEAVGFNPPPTIRRDEDIHAEGQKWSKTLKAKQSTADSVLVVIVLGAALLAGMLALYVDKAVGGLWDWLTIVAWGFATATVAEPIATAVQRAATD